MPSFMSSLAKFKRMAELSAEMALAEERAKPDTRPLWRSIARANQLPPEGDWLVWLILCGRGFGKTRTGAEWLNDKAMSVPKQFGTMVARTAGDVRNIMVCGESGILACARKESTPTYLPSQQKLLYPNGTVVYTFSAEKPDQIRGPNASFAWVEEFATYGRKLKEVWNNVKFSTRIGKPQICVTTTPRYLEELIKLRDHKRTYVTYGKTSDNIANLSEDVVNDLLRDYGGTILGLQELEGQIVADTSGALWSTALLESCRTHILQDCYRIVIGVDPAVSSNKKSCLTGIVVSGAYMVGSEEHFQVLEDRSGIYTPDEWANEVAWAYDSWHADLVVAEKNQGGDLVESNLRNAHPHLPIELVHASKGKATRAEPIRSLYGRNRVSHWHPDSDYSKPHRKLTILEGEMSSWVPSDAQTDSPDRVDAMVWGMTYLAENKRVSLGERISSPRR